MRVRIHTTTTTKNDHTMARSRMAPKQPSDAGRVRWRKGRVRVSERSRTKKKKKLSNKIDKHFIINQNRIYHVVM